MSETRDECRNCIMRGNLEECKKTPCSVHDSWYAKKLRRPSISTIIELMTHYRDFEINMDDFDAWDLLDRVLSDLRELEKRS